MNTTNSVASKRVLVTGAAGFVGGHSLPFLMANGFEVHAVDICISKEEFPGLYWHQVDLLDQKSCLELLETIHPTHLLHFAWYAKHGEYWNSLENLRWVEGSLHLLRAFYDKGGERVVMAGTCAEYDWRQEEDFSELTTPLIPASLYGVCKNALQNVLKDFSRVTGLSSAWGRIFFLYGPDEHPRRLVSSVISNLLRNQTAQCSHGMQVRDFLHVEDVASAFASLLMSPVQGPVNIASGCPVTLRDLVLAAADCLNARERVQFGVLPAPVDEPPRIVGHVSRLSDEVDWRPKYDLAAGMAQNVQCWRERLSRK